ncbi:MAG: PQQ-dependent sugar dehydrogenase [Candidatus Gracilibacteria bacterium]|nr:PQQ-dependent sugar dehydrogenase [Candidatus Gracilibacteria bacterium]
MKRNIALFGSVLFASLFFLTGCVHQPSDAGIVQREFDEKIVYQQGKTEARLKTHCENQGGVFDSCGSGCSDEADFCAAVCIPVCDLGDDASKNGNDSDQNDDQETVSFGGENRTGLPLEIRDGFAIEIWGEDLSGARDLVGPDGMGNYWLSRTDEGIISLLTPGEDGSLARTDDIFRDLNQPHGLALGIENRMTLYFAETDAVKRVSLYTDASPETLISLPEGGRHFTRTLQWGSDGKLYISIGSSCDTCVEEDERRATVYRMNPDGSEFELFSEGLRNAVFFTLNPVDGSLWVTEMGRDNLGDTLPPDEINILQSGAHYGWPYCYGDQVYDTEFDKRDADFCDTTVTPVYNLPAHVAPLGLDFVPEEGWPEDFRLDLLVALHGSWNRTNPVGYKVIQLPLTDQSQPADGLHDFVRGWLGEDGTVHGRPVDLVAQPGGILYITDDARGVVYRVTTLSDDSGSDSDQNGDGSEPPFTSENVRVQTPAPEAVISSPLAVEGEARGPWFFEATFSVELRNAAGAVIARSNAQADGEWMTEEFVPFSAELTFDSPADETGTLILQKANPSGLPANDASVSIPIQFSQ